MVKRIVTGAHYGLRDWLMQRITAAVMVIYTLVMAAYILFHPVGDYASWKAIFGHQLIRLATLLFLLSLFLHAWVGMRDIFMDYVHSTLIRLALHVAVILALVMYAIWSAQILWSIR